MTDNQTYSGDHFEIYRNIESLYYEPGNNIMLQVNYTSKTNSQKKSSDFWLPEVVGRGEGEFDEGGQTVQNSSHRAEKYNMINIINTAVRFI